MNAAELIKTMRTRAGLSVYDLAEKMGVYTSSIYAWESGKNVPSADKLLDVARATGYQLIFTKNRANYMEGEK